MNTLQAKEHLLYCPGELIQETIDEIGMSQIELAERMGRSEAKLNELIKGKAPITTDTAIKLSRIIGNSIGSIKKLDIRRSLQKLKNCKS